MSGTSVGRSVGGTDVGGGPGVGRGVGAGRGVGVARGAFRKDVGLGNGLNQNIHSGEVANTCPSCTTDTVQRHSPSLSAGKSVVLL
jgi:hypothetical protein